MVHNVQYRWLNPSTVLINKFEEVASVNWGRGLFFSNKYRLTAQVNSLPAYGTQEQICYVKMERNIRSFFGLIGTGWSSTSNTSPRVSPPNTFPWDGVPGGTRKGDDIASTGSFPEGHTFFGSLWRNILIGWFVHVNYDVTVPFINNSFTFVPITSSLDVENITSNTFSQQFNFSANGLSGSRADKFISQESTAGKYNIGHTDFTFRNARWMYNEMQNISQPTDCTQDQCAPLASNYKIIGPDMVCASAIYKLLNVPLNGTVSWATSPNYTVTPQNSNASEVLITITNSNAGSLLLSVNVQTPTTACFAATNFLISKQVQMGAPNATTFTPYITHGSNTTYMSTYCNKLTSLCEGQVPVSSRAEGKPPVINIVSPYNYCASGYITDANATSITWSMLQKSSSFHGYYNFSGNQFNVGINLNYPLEWVVLRCTRTNECGSSYNDYKFYADNKMCVGTVEERVSTPIYTELEKKPAINTSVEVSPIPSKGYLKISLVENLKSSSINQIVIKNKMGAIIYNRPFKNGQTFQNINFMVPVTDVYFLMVFDGMQWFNQKITLLK